jgi:hypothetical protein
VLGLEAFGVRDELLCKKEVVIDGHAWYFVIFKHNYLWTFFRGLK